MWTKITSFLMALIVLSSTFSFTIEKHMCMGTVADYSFFGNTEKCEMPGNDHQDGALLSFKKQSCCQDLVHILESTNNELLVVKNYDAHKIELAAVFLVAYLYNFEDLKENSTPFQDHSPPIIVKDFQVIYDTFLI